MQFLEGLFCSPAIPHPDRPDLMVREYFRFYRDGRVATGPIAAPDPVDVPWFGWSKETGQKWTYDLDAQSGVLRLTPADAAALPARMGCVTFDPLVLEVAADVSIAPASAGALTLIQIDPAAPETDRPAAPSPDLPVPPPVQGRATRRFEYGQIRFNQDPARGTDNGWLLLPGVRHDLGSSTSVLTLLNKLGEQGWELVGTPESENSVFTFEASNGTWHDKASWLTRRYWLKREIVID